MWEQPFAVPSALLFAFAVPMALGLIPPNRFYGVRTARTLADRGAWYRANRVAGVAVMAAGAVYFAVALARPYDRRASGDFSTWLVHLAAFAVPIAAGLLVAVRSARS